MTSQQVVLDSYAVQSETTGDKTEIRQGRQEGSRLIGVHDCECCPHPKAMMATCDTSRTRCSAAVNVTRVLSAIRAAVGTLNNQTPDRTSSKPVTTHTPLVRVAQVRAMSAAIRTSMLTWWLLKREEVMRAGGGYCEKHSSSAVKEAHLASHPGRRFQTGGPKEH